MISLISSSFVDDPWRHRTGRWGIGGCRLRRCRSIDPGERGAYRRVGAVSKPPDVERGGRWHDGPRPAVCQQRSWSAGGSVQVAHDRVCGRSAALTASDLVISRRWDPEHVQRPALGTVLHQPAQCRADFIGRRLRTTYSRPPRLGWYQTSRMVEQKRGQGIARSNLVVSGVAAFGRSVGNSRHRGAVAFSKRTVSRDRPALARGRGSLRTNGKVEAGKTGRGFRHGFHPRPRRSVRARLFVSTYPGSTEMRTLSRKISVRSLLRVRLDKRFWSLKTRRRSDT